MDLKNKHVLITGASGGIGLAIAKLVAQEAAVTYCHYNNNPNQSLSGVTWLKADYRKSQEIESTFQEIPGLDVLINVVGIEMDTKDVLDLSTWEEIFKVNLLGAVKTTNEAIKKMDHGGVIIYISSLVGKPGVTFKGDSIAYPASKAALNKLMEGVVAVYGPKIRSACISPGYVKTQMWDRFDAAIVAESLSNVPNQKFVEPDQVASLIKEIIQNEAITGTNFEIDNGLGLKLIF